MHLQEKHHRVEDRYLTLKRHMADEERKQKMGFDTRSSGLGFAQQQFQLHS